MCRFLFFSVRWRRARRTLPGVCLYAIAASVVICSLFSSPAQAQTSFSALYDFTGTAGNQASSPVTSGVPAHLSLSDLGRGPGLSASAGANSFNSIGWTTAASVDPGDYCGLTLTPDSGYRVHLTALSFTLRRSGTGPANFALRSSDDGFASDLRLFSVASTTDSAQNLDLSAIEALSGINGPLTLRLYGYSAAGGTGTMRLLSASAGQGLMLSGSIQAASVIPEPSTLALTAAGVLGGALLCHMAGRIRHRRRHRARLRVRVGGRPVARRTCRSMSIGPK